MDSALRRQPEHEQSKEPAVFRAHARKARIARIANDEDESAEGGVANVVSVGAKLGHRWFGRRPKLHREIGIEKAQHWCDVLVVASMIQTSDCSTLALHLLVSMVRIVAAEVTILFIFVSYQTLTSTELRKSIG